MLSSIEWTTRYAKNAAGETYPMSLFEKELKKLHRLSPLGMNGISSVMNFERKVYEEKNLTQTKLKNISRKISKKYSSSRIESYRFLSVPHIYTWESSCSYQGYGLAQIALSQWREYFYKKYGYIVDNKNVGKEMKKMWSHGSALPFPECVKLATGKKLSPDSYIRAVTASLPAVKRRVNQKIDRLKKVKAHTGPIMLNAKIRMVHGKKVVATNNKSFEDMAKKYAAWLKKQ